MEFCVGGSDHRPVSMRLSSRCSADWEAKKAKIRAELLARRERQILEEEVRRELGLEREMMFRCCHGEREETLPVASSWDKFYDNEPDVDGLRRYQMGSLDRLTVDVGFENSSASREAKKAKIRAELLARRERQVLEEEVIRELGLEREMMFRCSHGERDDGSLVPRLGFEGRHLPSFVKDTLRRSPAAALPDLMLRPAVKRSASPPEENVRPLPPFPDFLPLDSVEPEPSSRPSLVVVDSVSKPCVEPVSSPPKPVPMVTVYKPEIRLSRPSPVPEYKPSSNNYSGIKRKFACNLCQITTTSKESLDDHFSGKRHKALIASNNSFASTSSDTCSSAEAENLNKPKNRAEFLCRVCGLRCNSWPILHSHLKEMNHWLSLRS